MTAAHGARRWNNPLWLKIALTAIVMLLGDWLFWQSNAFGSGIGLFAAVVALAALIARPAILRGWTGRLSYTAALLFAGALAWEPSIIGWLSYGVALGIAILSPRVEGFGDAWLWAQRIAWQVGSAPFLPLFDLIRLRKVRAKRGRRAHRWSLRQLLATVVLPLSGGAVFLLLFAAANPVIEGWVSGIGIGNLLDWLYPARWFVAGVWFLIAWNALRPFNTPRRWLMAGFDGTGDLAIPGVTAQSVTLSLLLFNAIFAAQNAMDIAWLWGLAPLPEGMTLAEYAHRGAYPLIATALLAGLFVLVTLRPGSTTAAKPLIRALFTLWVIQNIVLVASSILRTWDYVEAYSLTVLRIAALEWMVLVALGLAIILWRLWAEKSGRWLINANALAAALVIGAATMVDHGAIAANRNVEQAREIDGTGAALDLCYLNSLGGAALLPLARLEDRAGLDPIFRARVSSVRREIELTLRREDASNAWVWRNRQRLVALDAMPPRPLVRQTVIHRRCDGTVPPPDAPADHMEVMAVNPDDTAPAAADPSNKPPLTQEPSQ
jgi:hypothetical protein